MRERCERERERGVRGRVRGERCERERVRELDCRHQPLLSASL